MNQNPIKHDILWIASELCYYLGLMLAVFVPALALILWMISLEDKVDPNYWHILITWGLSILMFLTGVRLKNFLAGVEPSEPT